MSLNILRRFLDNCPNLSFTKIARFWTSPIPGRSQVSEGDPSEWPPLCFTKSLEYSVRESLAPEAKILADLGTQVSDEIRCFGRRRRNKWDLGTQVRGSKRVIWPNSGPKWVIWLNPGPKWSLACATWKNHNFRYPSVFSARSAKIFRILGTQVCIFKGI